MLAARGCGKAVICEFAFVAVSGLGCFKASKRKAPKACSNAMHTPFVLAPTLAESVCSVCSACIALLLREVRRLKDL